MTKENKKVIGLFGIPLFEKDFFFKEKDKFIKFGKNLTGRQVSNVGGFQSVDFVKSNEEVYASFINQVNKDVGEAVSMFLSCKFKLFPRAAWFNVNGKNHHNATHVHPNTDFTATVYLKVPLNSGDLIIDNPDPIKDNSNFYNASPDLTWDSLYARTRYQHKPREDSIVILPGYIPHLVSQNTTNKERISVSMNFLVEKIWEA
tara:strand:- start:721 stop:1329 length:609 start_codon:yes stop_codon:yes gene_type:complete